MFLSHINTRLDSGNLVLDLREHGGRLLRVGPWAEGMPCFANDDGHWVDARPSGELRLISNAHYARDLPVNRYLESCPRELRVALEPFLWRQAGMLQLCARHDAARDLAVANPLLLWLLADACARDEALHASVGQVLGLKQREILAIALGHRSAAEFQLRFLHRLVLMDGDRDTLRWLRCTVGRPARVQLFAHCARLPTSLLPFAHAQLLPRMRRLSRQLEGKSAWMIEQLLAPELGLYRDAHSLLRELRRIDRAGAERIVARAPMQWSARAIRRLHDALWRLYAAHWMNDPSALGVDPAASFGPPPVAGSEDIRPILDVQSLWEEAQAQSNCVLTRAPAVLAGRCYIYSVLGPEQRATLQLGIAADGEVTIDELRGRENAPAADSTLDLVVAWLDASNPDD